jgi:hypothetical protein
MVCAKVNYIAVNGILGGFKGLLGRTTKAKIVSDESENLLNN